MTQTDFTQNVQAQIDLLNEGKPLEAFDRWFAPDVKMYANDVLFATGAIEGRAKQEPFISAALAIFGDIGDLKVDENSGMCVFINRTSFVGPDNVKRQINGLSLQKWRAGKVIEERYYDGDAMKAALARNILDNPTDYFADLDRSDKINQNNVLAPCLVA